MDSERIGASGANEYFHAFLPRNFGQKDLHCLSGNRWEDGKMGTKKKAFGFEVVFFKGDFVGVQQICQKIVCSARRKSLRLPILL